MRDAAGFFATRAPAPGPRADDHRHAIDLFNAGCFWEAHEVWEALWRATPTTAAGERALWHGLAQAAAGCFAIAAGRAAAGARILARADRHLAAAATAALVVGIALAELRAELATHRPPRLTLGEPVT